MNSSKIDELISSYLNDQEDPAKNDIHAHMDNVKLKLETTIRLLFNPERSIAYLLLTGAVVLRIGVQMVKAASKEGGLSEDGAYQEIHQMIDSWRRNDAEGTVEAIVKEKKDV